MEEKLKQIFKFFDINDEEIEDFLVNDIGANSLDEFKINFKAIEKLADFLKINKDFIYGNSNNLLIEKDGFYKRSEKFCEEILSKNISTLYIISEKTPNKEIDEEDDGNYFYLVAEYSKKLFNNKEIKVFEVFNTNGCRWGYWRCRWELKKFLLCLKKNHSINKIMGIINENIVENYTKFIKGEIKFEDILGNLNIWYPEDYIEFKYENVNAKEEDELKEIIKEIEKIKISNEKLELIYKFKKYLIDVYGYSEDEIKIGYKINDFIYDLVILKNNDLISFKIVSSIKNVHKSDLEVKYHKINYLIEPYNDEWCFEEIFESNFPLQLQLEDKIEQVIENILKLLHLGGKRTVSKTIENFYNLLAFDKLVNFSEKEKNVLLRLRKLISPWEKNRQKKFKIFYQLLGKLNLKFDKYIDYDVLIFLKEIFKNKKIETNYPLPLILKKEFGFLIDNNSLYKMYFFDNNLIFDKEGIYFLPKDFLFKEEFKSDREKIKNKIKLILEFEEEIIYSSDFILLYLENKCKKCIIKKVSKKDLKRFEDYILHNKSDFFTIPHSKLYINRLDSFYNKKEFFILEEILFDEEAIKIKSFIEDNKMSFGRGKVGYGEEKLIVKESIKENKIKGKIYHIDRKLYKELPKLKENYLVIASVTKEPVYALVDKEHVDCVGGSGIICIYDERGKVLYQFFETVIGKIFLYRVINKYLDTPKINLENFKQIPILKHSYKDIISSIINKFRERVNKNIEDFFIEITGYQFEKESEFEYSEKKIIKGIYNKKFNKITTFKAKLSIKDVKKIPLNTTDFQRNSDIKHLEQLEKYLNNEQIEYKYIADIILGFDINNIREYEIEFEDYKMYINKDKYNEFLKNLLIIDGRHRLKKLQNIKNEDINVEFIFTTKAGMAVIFYILNAKVKPFISEDFMNLFQNNLKAFNELKILEELMPYFYNELFQQIEKNEIDKKLEKNFLNEVLIEISFFLNEVVHEKNKFDNKKRFLFKYIKNIFLRLKKAQKRYLFESENIIIGILKILIYEFYRNKKYEFIKKEIFGFLEWIEINKLENGIKNVKDTIEFYNIYQKTYIPKSRKIYLSMPYHAFQDTVYYVVDSVIRKISMELGFEIKLIRTDKHIKGVHTQIENSIFEEIEESDLLIADVTGNNSNVFHEIGFKMGLDRSKGLKNPNIIFIKDTRGYYEEDVKNNRKMNYEKDMFEVSSVIRKNEVSTVKFNLSHIQQIEFYDSQFLEDRLYEILTRYFNYYQIKKGKK